MPNRVRSRLERLEPMNQPPEDPKPPRYGGLPPPLLTPPKLRQAPVARKKPMSFFRVMLWLVLAAVLFVQFVWMRVGRDHPFPPRVIWQQEERGFRHPPTPLYTPVAEVPTNLYRLHIEIAPRDVEALRDYIWDGWRGQQAQRERPQVKVSVREGGVLYTNVALHLKGAAGSFRRFDDKPALTLNFRKHAKDQRFHGYSKISLNNSVQDPTYLCEAISRELFEAAGVPAPQTDFATVLINGRDLGLYVVVEGYNKDFLRRHFSNVSGNLYDGGFCQEVHRNLEVNSGDREEDRSDIDRLLAAARESSEEERWARMSDVLDMDRFITMLAMEVLTCHWDGYGQNRNNYRLFHDVDAGRMVFMPHGMDQMFAYPANRFSLDSSIQPAMNGMIAKAVLTTPEGLRQYRERLASLQTNLFKPEPIIARVRELAQRIRPTLAAYNPGLAEKHDGDVDDLCDRIARRIESVQAQLESPQTPVEFDAAGTARVTKWHRSFNGQARGVKLRQVEDGSQTLLHIAANRGGTGSWRARVLLPNGRYVLEGRARLSDNATGSRVVLRISGARTPGETGSGTDWIPLSFPFETEELESEVVLVCELKGNRGEAWFDLESLRLVRE